MKRIFNGAAAAHRKARKHGKPLDIEQLIAGNVSSGIEAHVANVFGETTCNFTGAHVGGGLGG